MIAKHMSGHAAGLLRRKTAIVIPVYLPAGVNQAHGRSLVEDTAARCCEQVEDPARVCLSVDGEACGGQTAAEVALALGASCCSARETQGKLRAVARGLRCLLERNDPAYVAVLDQDGDHFANELLSFVRVAEHAAGGVGTSRVLVLGQRSSRHRPMGFFRGELEELADRVLLDALHYRAAMSGRPLRLEYALALGEFPDFHSGYKLFSIDAARDVFLGPEKQAGVSDDAYYRHGVEAVMCVEALERGAYLAAVRRTTFNEQPISTFGLFERRQMVADKIIWPCKRLSIPARFVRQWLDNHVPQLLLNTVAPYGKEELTAIRTIVLAAFAGEDGGNPVEPLEPLYA